MEGRGRNARWTRACGGCRHAAADTWQGLRDALALLRRGVGTPLAVIVLLGALPSVATMLADASVARRISPILLLIGLLTELVCTPLMYALLSRVHLAKLRGAEADLPAALRDKLSGWRALLPLAVAGMALLHMGSYLPRFAEWLLSAATSPLTLIPGLDGAVSGVVFLLGRWIAVFTTLALGQALYFAWLTQEADGAPLMLSLIGAWRLLRRRAEAVVGLALSLSALEIAVLMLISLAKWWGNLWPRGILAGALEAAFLLLNTSYAAALFHADRGGHPRGADPYAAPEDLDHMKRANP